MPWGNLLPKIWPFVHYRTIFGNERKPPGGGQYVENSESGKLWIEMTRRCPECHHAPINLAEGPSGGACVNVFCMDCGQGFNITPMCQVADRIHKDVRYISKEKT